MWNEGHVVTLFLYIDLYFVLLLLFSPLFPCVCDARERPMLLGYKVVGYSRTGGGLQSSILCVLDERLL